MGTQACIRAQPVGRTPECFIQVVLQEASPAVVVSEACQALAQVEKLCLFSVPCTSHL